VLNPAKDETEFTLPTFVGRTRARKIYFYGARPDSKTRLVGDEWAIGKLYKTDSSFGFINMRGDGRSGSTQKGFILGSAKATEDAHESPANDTFFQAFELYGVEQQLFKFSDNSRRMNMIDVYFHDNGYSSSYSELFYGGEGEIPEHMQGTLNPGAVRIRGMKLEGGSGSELFDWKVNATDLDLKYFEMSDVELPYSGALTIAIDNKAAPHGKPTGWKASHGWIRDVRRTRHTVSGIQLGAGGVAERLLIEDVNGYGIQLLDHAVGPDKTLVLSDSIIRRTAKTTIQRGGSTLTDKSKAVSPMELEMSNVWTDDGEGTHSNLLRRKARTRRPMRCWNSRQS